jgi:hypothetical protein
MARVPYLAPGSTAELMNWPAGNLVPGPFWPSFEQFRVAGATALESIQPGTAATLHIKGALYRILREEDFQRLLGVASEAHRLQAGLGLVAQAAKVVAKHKDADSVEMLVRSLAVLGEPAALGVRDGHGQFEVAKEDTAGDTENTDLDLDNIPRPSIT